MIQRHKIDKSIANPSVPWYFIERWNFNPADSFNLLPVFDLGQDCHMGIELPLAPVWSRGRVWTAGMCQFCGQEHVTGKRQYGSNGPWRCNREMPVFWMVPVSNRPNDRELAKYFPMWAPRASTRMRGGLYLIRAGGRYKIGISSNPKKRISSIATSSPFPVEVVHIEQTDNYANLEKYIHKTFAGNRVHREWFEFDESFVPTVIETIQEWA